MNTRWIVAALTGAAILAGAGAALRAQNGGANQGQDQDQGNGPQLSPEQQAQVQQLQDMRDQVLQNMQNAGMDPQAFQDQMRQQMQNGTFDPQAIGQQLMQQGIINPDLMQRARGTMQDLTLTSVRQALGSPDDEWAVLELKFQRLLAAKADAEQNVTTTGMIRFISGQNQETPAMKAMKDLQAELDDPQGSTPKLAEKLIVWRQLHAKAKQELQAATADLTGLLTLRQEAVLVCIGLL